MRCLVPHRQCPCRALHTCSVLDALHVLLVAVGRESGQGIEHCTLRYVVQRKHSPGPAAAMEVPRLCSKPLVTKQTCKWLDKGKKTHFRQGLREDDKICGPIQVEPPQNLAGMFTNGLKSKCSCSRIWQARVLHPPRGSCLQAYHFLLLLV